jgi:hypothetical protein
MIETRIHEIDKKTWHKWLFYINIVVFIIIAISIYLLIIDSYKAGTLRDTTDPLAQAMLHVARDVAFLAISLTYIFFQLFKYQRLIIRRSW